VFEMKVRNKTTRALGTSSTFNTHGMSEIIVGFQDDGMDSDYIKNYEVYLEVTKCWKDLSLAFRDRDVIIDNYNTKFFEPPTEEDRIRGFTL